MRKIKFRGKSQIDGKWVYGSLIVKEFLEPNWNDLSKQILFKQCEICSKNEKDWTSLYKNIPVWGETVGQFTGLYDKNGKEIYEGDIIDFDEKEWGCKHIEVVKFDYEYLYLRHSDFQQWCTVIGNLWDNPELLKEIKDNEN